jgi:hypothetical protein
MKIHFAILIFMAAAAVPAQAKSPKVLEATMVPKSDATLRALSAVIADSENRQARLNDRVATLEAQIAALKAKVKNPKVEVGEQLSKEDLDAFNLLNTQLRYLQNAIVIEAVRQKNLIIAREIYRASYFTATMMGEYVGDKGGLDDDFDDFCRAKAKAYGMDMPVDLLLSVEDYAIDASDNPKK